MILLVCLSFWGLQIFASDNTEVGSLVIEKFKTDFPKATGASWAAMKEHYVVSFKIDGETRKAYYTQEAEFVAVARLIHFGQMPLIAQQTLFERFPESAGFLFTDVSEEPGKQVFEVNDKERGTYYLVRVKSEKNFRYVRVNAEGVLVVERKVKSKVQD